MATVTKIEMASSTEENSGFGWGEKREKIGETARFIVMRMMMKERVGSITITLEQLRLAVSEKIGFGVPSLELINGVRQDRSLGRNMTLSALKGEQFFTLYCADMKHILESRVGKKLEPRKKRRNLLTGRRKGVAPAWKRSGQ